MITFKEDQILDYELNEDTINDFKKLLEDIYYMEVTNIKTINHKKWNRRIEFDYRDVFVLFCKVEDNKIVNYQLRNRKKS